MNTTTTVKQMKNRMLQGHRLALEAVRDGRQLEWRYPSEYAGYRRVMDTLRRWGAVDASGITEIGKELLS